LALETSMIEKVHHQKHRPIHEQYRPVSIFIKVRRLLFQIFLMLGLLVIATATATLLGGRLGYYNYLRLPVFAPFAIVVGAVFLVWTFVMWKKVKAAESAPPDRVKCPTSALKPKPAHLAGWALADRSSNCLILTFPSGNTAQISNSPPIALT
jgi:hypothetical protein